MLDGSIPTPEKERCVLGHGVMLVNDVGWIHTPATMHKSLFFLLVSDRTGSELIMGHIIFKNQTIPQSEPDVNAQENKGNCYWKGCVYCKPSDPCLRRCVDQIRHVPRWRDASGNREEVSPRRNHGGVEFAHCRSHGTAPA